MATSRTEKVNAEIEKVKAKIAEQQGKLKELEHKRTEFENMEIVDIVRGLNVPLDQLAAALATIKTGAVTSGQAVQKSQTPIKNETEDENE
jgi:uncharacterized protein (DUF111 family)